MDEKKESGSLLYRLVVALFVFIVLQVVMPYVVLAVTLVMQLIGMIASLIWRTFLGLFRRGGPSIKGAEGPNS